MRVVLLISAAACAFATVNTIDTSGAWFGDAKHWSLKRFPRVGDTASIAANTEVVFEESDKPEAYDGATEGDILDVGIGAELEIEGEFNIGPQNDDPVHCVEGEWGSWEYDSVVGGCSATCGVPGTQSRSRTLKHPTFGGDKCGSPDDSQVCHIECCENGKVDGAIYTGFGSNFCNRCTCNGAIDPEDGVEKCTQRKCTQDGDVECDQTTCSYGPLFPGDDESYTVTEAKSKFGQDWALMDHEMTTSVKHHSEDKAGPIFNCGHVRGSVDTCKCYCSDKGQKKIWHHHKLLTSVALSGKTSGGCDCLADWTFGAQGPFTGCQETTAPDNKPHKWCKVDSSTCKHHAAVSHAATFDWDLCEEHGTFKLALVGTPPEAKK